MDNEELEDFVQNNLEALKSKLDQFQNEMRSSKPQENLNVRKVDTDEGEKIVVEYSVQRWYSPNYFKKMLNVDTSDSNQKTENDEDTIL